MISIDTQKKLINFKGEALKDNEGEELTLGIALHLMLLNSNLGGKYKLYKLAERFFKEKKVELDDADFGLVKSIVEKDPVFSNNLVSGQVLDFLEKSVEKSQQ